MTSNLEFDFEVKERKEWFFYAVFHFVLVVISLFLILSVSAIIIQVFPFQNGSVSPVLSGLALVSIFGVLSMSFNVYMTIYYFSKELEEEGKLEVKT